MPNRKCNTIDRAQAERPRGLSNNADTIPVMVAMMLIVRLRISIGRLSRGTASNTNGIPSACERDADDTNEFAGLKVLAL